MFGSVLGVFAFAVMQVGEGLRRRFGEHDDVSVYFGGELRLDGFVEEVIAVLIGSLLFWLGFCRLAADCRGSALLSSRQDLGFAGR